MADLFESGLAWLASKRRDHASAACIYQLGEQEISVNVTWARVDREVAEGTDYRLQNELRDALISADEMTLGAPQVHAKIIEVKDGTTRIYEVLPLEGSQHWRWVGNREALYRIHVKQISVT